MTFGIGTGLFKSNTLSTGGGAAIGLRFLPDVFSDGTFPLTISYDKNQAIGSRWSTNFAAATFKDTGTTYYVTKSGNDGTGDGSSGAPWLTIQHAIDNVPNGSVIEIGAGRYYEAPRWANEGMYMSLVAASGATVIIGDIVAEADISAWGALDGDGYLTCTLSSGTIDGFADLSNNRQGYPGCARTVTTKAAGDTWKAAGDPAFLSTTSALSTVDERDLDGEADSTIIIWRTDTIAATATTGDCTLYFENLIMCGKHFNKAGSTIVYNGCQLLGSATDVLDVAASTVIFNNGVVRCASPDSSNDTVNLYDDATMMELDSVIDQPSTGSTDQASTGHVACRVVSIGTRYDADGGQTVIDIDESIRLMVDCSAGDTAALKSGNNGIWIQGITFDGTGNAIGDATFPSYIIDEAAADYSTVNFAGNETEIDSATYIHSETVPIATSDPTAISDCIGFFDSTDSASIKTSGSNVTSWDNLVTSGGAGDFALETGTPTVVTDSKTGRQVVRCGTGVSMLGSGIATLINNAQEFFYYAIIKNHDSTNYRAGISLGDYDDGINYYMSGGIYTPAIYQNNLLRVGATSYNVNAGIAYPLYQWFFAAVWFDGSTLRMYKDSAYKEKANSPTLNFDDAWPLNRRGTGTTASAPLCYHAEHGLYNRALTATEIANLRQRAINLYGTRP